MFTLIVMFLILRALMRLSWTCRPWWMYGGWGMRRRPPMGGFGPGWGFGPGPRGMGRCGRW